MSATNLAEIMPLVEKLSPEEKLQLIEHVARDLQRKPQATLRLSWKDARGLGKEIWEGVDVDRYIDELRNEWDR
ncbi:MAG TPA: hypothetical protein VKE24_10630 [Candidatus Acidoferrales bacterium]|nr:hypothetical protein [Candidatus Acidoferrales bacterium]